MTKSKKSNEFFSLNISPLSHNVVGNNAYKENSNKISKLVFSRKNPGNPYNYPDIQKNP
jgi:hypothetical protein